MDSNYSKAFLRLEADLEIHNFMMATSLGLVDSSELEARLRANEIEKTEAILTSNSALSELHVCQ